MRQPCAKECPLRTSTCRIDCEKYKEYRKAKEEEYKKRREDYILQDTEFRMKPKRRR